ncbi:MAG TPA: alkaline phosphatase D family protein, partial [Lichenihabitans sp.]|nr:alkaline phosphatase D family protein [Lichenihabitans sp.]
MPFRPTERGEPEFGTAIADAAGLEPDTSYTYAVRAPDGVVVARGFVRTFPPPGDRGDLVFASASCDSLNVAGGQPNPGAWELLAERVRRREPRFLVLLGDQVYMDEVEAIWALPLDLDRRERRRRMAEVYRRFWSRAPVAEILANVPTYMMWDDHEIRNGWGSDPGDSPTLACRYPRGRQISAQYEAFFEDARQVYWHFQHVRNPATPGLDGAAFLEPGTRHAMPFAFACGATRLLILDNRGARDVWRDRQPVLGEAQWRTLREMLRQLDTRTDSLVVVVPLPVVSMPDHGLIQVMLGRRRDDVRLFRQGKVADLKTFPEKGEPASG